MVKKKFHHGEVRQNTTVPVPLHHGAVKTPPWWSGNATTVKFLQHHGVLSDFSMVICQWNRGCAPPKLPRLRCKAKARTSSRAPQNFPTQKVSRFLLRRGENQSTQPNLHNGVKKNGNKPTHHRKQSIGQPHLPQRDRMLHTAVNFLPEMFGKIARNPYFCTNYSESSAVGSALRSGRRGRAFESPLSDKAGIRLNACFFFKIHQLKGKSSVSPK